MNEHLDGATWLTIFVTLLLFITALFLKGLTHDMLLEAAVFLVSVKLVIMSYKASINARDLRMRLDSLGAALERMEQALPARVQR
jgi:hypothetical protein